MKRPLVVVPLIEIIDSQPKRVVNTQAILDINIRLMVKEELKNMIEKTYGASYILKNRPYMEEFYTIQFLEGFLCHHLNFLM